MKKLEYFVRRNGKAIFNILAMVALVASETCKRCFYEAPEPKGLEEFITRSSFYKKQDMSRTEEKNYKNEVKRGNN